MFYDIKNYSALLRNITTITVARCWTSISPILNPVNHCYSGLDPDIHSNWTWEKIILPTPYKTWHTAPHRSADYYGVDF